MGRRLPLPLATPLLVAGCAGPRPASQSPVANVSTSDDDGLHGIVLPSAYHVPSRSLVDTAGRPHDLARAATRPVMLVFFGYTHGPDVCQVVMASLASALVRLDPAHRRRVGMVFVTTDPRRDTSRVLRSYLDRFDPAFEGLTGPLPTVVALGKALGVPVETGTKLASGGYDVAHDLTAILDLKVPTP